jgi:hypothetical protein
MLQSSCTSTNLTVKIVVAESFCNISFFPKRLAEENVSNKIKDSCTELHELNGNLCTYVILRQPHLSEQA